MTFDSDAAIRLLTIATLSGLLFSTGLRLTWSEMAGSLRHNRLAWMLPVNFILVPALAFTLARLFQIPTNTTIAILLLAAAPFAPVVPTFTRLARGDLALAGALTALFPFLSAFLTPLVCEFSLKPLLTDNSLKFNVASILLTLVSTITLPLLAGVVLHHIAPRLAGLLLKPVQVFSEATGAVSLIFVVTVESQIIFSIGWKPLIAMVLLCELSFLAGYLTSGPAPASRLVVAFGTANRNIALALLVAVQSFPTGPVIAAVAANGLVMILLGLVHVGCWRLFASARLRSSIAQA